MQLYLHVCSFSVRDCLHRFVTVAATNGELNLLCSRFPFVGLQEEVERTLQFKAKSGPVYVPGHNMETNYYGVLWGYFVFRGDYRNGKRTNAGFGWGFSCYILANLRLMISTLASAAMYEYSRRLNALTSQERGRKGAPAKIQAIVTEQARALLAALNALSLVREGSRWILDESGEVGGERVSFGCGFGGGRVIDIDTDGAGLG